MAPGAAFLYFWIEILLFLYGLKEMTQFSSYLKIRTSRAKIRSGKHPGNISSKVAIS